MKKMIRTLTPSPEIRQGDLFGKDVRVVWKNDEPLFVMKDVCAMIEISKYRDALSRLHEDETCPVVVDTNRGPREMTAVTESGLYHLIFMSRKPIAEAFRRWVTSEVLPSLRKHGYYATGAHGEITDQKAYLRWLSEKSRSGSTESANSANIFVYETARHYLENRGLKLSASGVSRTCRYFCDNFQIYPRRHYGGMLYPLHILDLAVSDRDKNATRGPAFPKKPDIISFYTDITGANP